MISPLDRYCVVGNIGFLREGIGIDSGIKSADANFAAVLKGENWLGRKDSKINRVCSNSLRIAAFLVFPTT
jgi:hypothetical protein